ncbi:MAG: HAMP domain-containing sensor histidine kinase [Hyphomonas sp.]|uniref:sensor histidine kinase n=1 Tax=Hyphomonas sp. TaxID=87 RepID=UPI0035289E50
MFTADRNFLGYVLVRPDLGPDARAERFLLRQHLEFARSTHHLATIILINSLAFTAFATIGLGESNVLVWLPLNLVVALMLFRDWLRRSKMTAPQSVSGSYLRKNETVALVAGALWGSAPFFLFDEAHLPLLVGATISIPMAGGLLSLIPKNPRVVLRYAAGTWFTAAVYTAAHPSVANFVMLFMNAVYAYSLILGLRSTFLAHLAEFQERSRSEEAHDLLMSALESSGQAFAILDKNDQTKVANSEHNFLVTKLGVTVENTNRTIRTPGALWMRTFNRLPSGDSVVIHTNITAIENAKQDLEAARAEADQANRAKSIFLDHMGMHLRAPVNTIRAVCEVTGRDSQIRVDEDQLRAYIDTIGTEARHLAATLEQINEYLELEKDDNNIYVDSFEPCDVIEQSLGQLPEMQKDAVSVICDEGFSLSIQRSTFQRVLCKLVSNALTHGQARGVQVRARLLPDGRAAILVRDRGPGMSEQQLAIAATPFQGLLERNMHQDSRSVGLGLAIAKGLCQKLGLTLEIKNGRESGVVATIIVPAALVDRKSSDADINQIFRSA